jgi:chaperonin GroES
VPKQFYPINDRVSIRPDRDQQVTKGGIVLTESAQGVSEEGVVLEVGAGHLSRDGRYVPLRVEPGDRVVYLKHGGLELECNGEKIVVVNDAQIVGKCSA